jgi:hypothetical protein
MMQKMATDAINKREINKRKGNAAKSIKLTNLSFAIKKSSAKI